MESLPTHSTNWTSNWTFEDTVPSTSVPLTFYLNDSGSGNVTEPVPFLWSNQRSVRLPVAIFLILLCFVSLVVNVVILSSICFINKRVNNTVYISFCLAAADTFSLFFLMVVYLVFSLIPLFFGVSYKLNCFYIFIEGLRTGAIMTNMFHLLALACIHYIGILNPFQIITRRQIQYCIAVLWPMPSSLVMLEMFYLEEGLQAKDDGFECQMEFISRSKFRMRFCVPFFLMLSMMVFIYVHIYILVSKHQTQNMEQGYRHGNNQVTKKTIVTTMMILGSVILGWLPPFSYYALVCEDCLLTDSWRRLYNTDEAFVINTGLNILLILKPATNFYIYAIHITEIRGAMRRMRRRMLMRLHSPTSITSHDNSSRRKPRTASLHRATQSLRISTSWNHCSAVNGLHPTVPAPTLQRCRSAATRHSKDTPV